MAFLLVTPAYAQLNGNNKNQDGGAGANRGQSHEYVTQQQQSDSNGGVIHFLGKYASSPAAACTQEPTDKQEKWTHKFFCEVNIADAIIALFTALLVFVTAGLIRVGARQESTIRHQLRAYIHPDNVYLGEGSLLNPPEPAHANEPGVVLITKNNGQTPGNEVISWAQIAVIEPSRENELVVPPLQNIHSASLGANGTMNKSLWFGRALTPTELDDILVGNRAIYLYGRVEYRDIFRRKRTTNFRLFYTDVFPHANMIMRFSLNGNKTT